MSITGRCFNRLLYGRVNFDTKTARVIMGQVLFSDSWLEI